MHPRERTNWKIWTIGILILAGLVLATPAVANDRSRRQRINDHFDILAAVVALSGDAYLALQIDRVGGRIEHRSRHLRHASHRWRRFHRPHRPHRLHQPQRRHDRHFDGCGHRRLEQRSGHGRHFWERRRHSH